MTQRAFEVSIGILMLFTGTAVPLILHFASDRPIPGRLIFGCAAFILFGLLWIARPRLRNLFR